MIQEYEGVLPPEFCEHLIHRFDAEEKKDQSHDMFIQLEIGQWQDECEGLIDVVKRIGEHYSAQYDPYRMMPQRRCIEDFRIKRYEPNKHSFPLHADASSAESCTRYLAFLCYLNDSEAGTKFYMPKNVGDLTIEAKQGKMLVFPPMWMFPHEGIMPTEKRKYILSTYFHYV